MKTILKEDEIEFIKFSANIANVSYFEVSFNYRNALKPEKDVSLSVASESSIKMEKRVTNIARYFFKNVKTYVVNTCVKWKKICSFLLFKH